MENNDELLKLIAQQEEETLNVKEFLFKMLNYWYWFVLAVFLGLGGAWLYVRYVPPSYSVSSLVLVKEKESGGMSLDNLFDNFQMKSNVKIENHIGVLTSFHLNRQVVENLGWTVSWYRKMPFGDYNLFNKEPYQIVFDPAGPNLHGINLYVSPTGEGKYKVSVFGKATEGGQAFEVEFEQEGEFGKEFRNQYFNFILEENGHAADDGQYFRFNDLDALAKTYLEKIEVGAVNKNADLISLKLEGQSAIQEIQYLNELTNVYIRFGLQEKNLTSENTIHFIDRQLADIVDTLRVTGDNFSNYRANNKVFDLGQQASLVVEKLVDLDSKKSLAQMQLNYYENLNSYLDNSDKMKKMIAPSVVGIMDVSLNNLVTKLAELYSKKEMLSYNLQDKNPGIQLIDRELEYAKKSLGENLKNLVYNTRQELESIGKEIDEMNQQLGNYPKTEQNLINIKRMFDLNNELYTFLLQKRAEAEIAKASNIPDVKVLDPASPATSLKTGPKKMLNLLLGLFAGLAVPFVVIVARDYFDENIRSKEDVQKLTSVPVAADITHNTFSEIVPVMAHPRSVLAESFRELRTKLDYLYQGEGPMVIGVQSVVPGEGKSFVSLNLSAIIAMNDKKVVLIGADMRKPTLHKLLNTSFKEGLSTYLIGQHSLDELIRPTTVEHLDFIASGIIPPNPAELLGTKRFGTLIGELKKRYDVIVIDNSPASLVTDGAIVGRHTDVDLFITRHGYSHKNLITFIDQLTEKNKLKKSAIVLNDIKPRKYGNYSYRYGGYTRKAYGSEEGYFDDGTAKKPKRKYLNSKSTINS
jgi:capsular exopolysaccharide synthesis family protein